MNKRAVIVLGVITAALIAYVAVFERTSLSTKELEERKARVLTTFVRTKVDGLEIERKGKRVKLERKPDEEEKLGTWQMLEPYQATADEDAVDQVLGELEWLTARRTLESLSADDQKSFGLSAPRYRIHYRVAGEKHVLAVGNEDVHGDGVYVRVDDENAAFVVPKTLVEALDHDPGHYRTKEFLGQMTVAWAKRLEIEADGQKLEVAKENGRFWFLGEPKTYADGKRVDDTLRALDDLRATRFVEDEDEVAAAQADLAKPARVVRLRIVPDEQREDKEPQLVELVIGGTCQGHDGERFARSGASGTPVCISNEDAKTFELGSGDLREARLFAADPSEIERIELVQGAQKLALTRDGENWKPEGDVPVDRQAVEIWLADLAAHRAQSFMPAGAFTERGALTFKLVGDKTERVALAAPTADGVVVKRGDEPALVRFGAGLAVALEPSKKRFGALTPWASHQPSEVVAIEVRDADKKRSLVLADGVWRAAPTGPEVPDAMKVRELLRALVKVEMRNFTSEQARPEQGFAAPRASLALKLTNGTLSLDVGNLTDHGAYARVDGGTVYEVGTQVLAQLGELAGVPRPPTAAPPAHDAGADEHEGDHEHDHLH